MMASIVGGKTPAIIDREAVEGIMERLAGVLGIFDSGPEHGPDQDLLDALEVSDEGDTHGEDWMVLS